MSDQNPAPTITGELGKINVPDAEKTVAAVVTETKAGYKTTEFWGVLAVGVLDVVTQIPMHDKLWASVIAGAYAVARGLAKGGVPFVGRP